MLSNFHIIKRSNLEQQARLWTSSFLLAAAQNLQVGLGGFEWCRMVEDGVVVFRVDGWCGWMCLGSENMENGEGWVRLREGE